jgi:hypothetical protein
VVVQELGISAFLLNLAAQDASPAEFDNRAGQRSTAKYPEDCSGPGKPRLGAQRRWRGEPVRSSSTMATPRRLSSNRVHLARARRIQSRRIDSLAAWRARNSQRSVEASHCSFESLAHNSKWATQHF